MNKTITWKLRGATLAFGAGLTTAAFVACGGDSGNTTDGGTDGSMSTSSTSSVATSSGSTSAGTSSAATSSATLSDAGDGGHDGSSDATMGDGAVVTSDGGDSSVNADADAAPAPLNLCGVLDNDWGFVAQADASVAAVQSLRADYWGTVVNDNMSALILDCNIGNLTVGPDGGNCGVGYGSIVSAFAMGLLGCPTTGDGGPIGYGLIPACQTGHQFTTADLNLLNSFFLEALNLAASGTDIPMNNGYSPAPTAGPLTQAQLDAVAAKLSSLAASVGPLTSNKYTVSTCPVPPSDAGTDAPSDAPNDGG